MPPKKSRKKRTTSRVYYPELAGRESSSTVTVTRSDINGVYAKYRSHDPSAKAITTPDGLVVLDKGAMDAIDAAIKMHDKNRQTYSRKNSKFIINPKESQIIEIEPGIAYVDLKVYAKPKYRSTIAIRDKKGRWRSKPFSKIMARRVRKKGVFKR